MRPGGPTGNSPARLGPGTDRNIHSFSGAPKGAAPNYVSPLPRLVTILALNRFHALTDVATSCRSSGPGYPLHAHADDLADEADDVVGVVVAGASGLWIDCGLVICTIVAYRLHRCTCRPGKLPLRPVAAARTFDL